MSDPLVDREQFSGVGGLVGNTLLIYLVGALFDNIHIWVMLAVDGMPEQVNSVCVRSGEQEQLHDVRQTIFSLVGANQMQWTLCFYSGLVPVVNGCGYAKA
jgi:hypothetical protein